MTEKGHFIVFEGLDGAGTTTQAALLAEWMRGRGRSVHETAEPSTGPIGRLLRQVLKGELAERKDEKVDPRTIAGLFVADRADHLTFEIEPNLVGGTDVVCDRYLHSSLAYQGVECDRHWVAAINSPMRAPDLVLLLRVPAALAGQRRSARDEPTEIYEQDTFQTKVAEGYDRVGELRPDDHIVVIDGSGSIDAVQAQCRQAVLELIASVELSGGES